MPYETNADLPENLQRLLPPRAQDIFRATFNSAFFAHADDPGREEAAHRIAWAAVKRRYERTPEGWRARGDRSGES